MSTKERTQQDKFIALFRTLVCLLEKNELDSFEVVDCFAKFPGNKSRMGLQPATCEKLEIIFRPKDEN